MMQSKSVSVLSTPIALFPELASTTLEPYFDSSSVTMICLSNSDSPTTRMRMAAFIVAWGMGQRQEGHASKATVSAGQLQQIRLARGVERERDRLVRRVDHFLRVRARPHED